MTRRGELRLARVQTPNSLGGNYAFKRPRHNSLPHGKKKKNARNSPERRERDERLFSGRENRTGDYSGWETFSVETPGTSAILSVSDKNSMRMFLSGCAILSRPRLSVTSVCTCHSALLDVWNSCEIFQSSFEYFVHETADDGAVPTRRRNTQNYCEKTMERINFSNRKSRRKCEEEKSMTWEGRPEGMAPRRVFKK